MSVWKTDLVTVSVLTRDPTISVFYPANIKSTSTSPHKEVLSMLIPTRRRSNIVLRHPRFSCMYLVLFQKKSLPSICRNCSEIDQTSVQHLLDIAQLLPAWAIIPTVIRFSNITRNTPEARVHFPAAKVSRPSSDASLILEVPIDIKKPSPRPERHPRSLLGQASSPRASFKHCTKPGSQYIIHCGCFC